MKDKIKHLIKKSLTVLPWVILIALGVHFSSVALADWHYRNFTAPFIENNYSQKLSQ
jgi:hypothetical protein